MAINGVIKEPDILEKRCRFCGARLGKVNVWKLKLKKTCRCPKCHKKIDERLVIY